MPNYMQKNQDHSSMQTWNNWFNMVITLIEILAFLHMKVK